jgi:hypothetical protein
MEYQEGRTEPGKVVVSLDKSDTVMRGGPAFEGFWSLGARPSVLGGRGF